MKNNSRGKRLSKRSLFLFDSLWLNRQLIFRMIMRDVASRYRGSALGLFWSLVHPLLMLTIYTTIFSVVFKVKWGGGHAETRTEFAVILFAGLIVFNLFSEVINRSPTLILSNVSYVKKVIFPLEILTVIATGSAFFHGLISTLVLLAFQMLIHHSIPSTAFVFPVVIFPLLMLILGCSWLLASMGVFIRDVGQTVGIFTTALMFLSPIFFPISALPKQMQAFLCVNPLAIIIEQTRDVLIWGNFPNLGVLFLNILLSTAFAWVGLYWFHKTKKGFADVL